MTSTLRRNGRSRLTEFRSQDIGLIASRMRKPLNTRLQYTANHATYNANSKASEYDVIVIMDSSNRRLLSHIISPLNMAKVHKMMEYAGRNSDVSDPWYTGDFERTYMDIAEGCKGLLASLMGGERDNDL